MKPLSITISAGSIFVAILLVLLVGLLFYLRDLVLIVLTAIVIASSIEPAVHAFTKRGVPRIWGVIVSYLLVLGTFFGLLVAFVPPILDEAAIFLSRLPETLASLNFSSLAPGWLPSSIGNSVSSAQLLDSISKTLTDTTGGVFTTFSAFFGGITSFVLIVVFSFYFSVQETGVDDFLRVVTPVKHQAYVLDLWKRSQDKIGKWMQGQLVLGVIVGILLYLGLTILGVPYALLLAVLAGLMELIPVFGQFIAAVPAIAIAFVAGGVTEAGLVAGLYLVVQQFEAHLIYPVVVKKVVGVPPLLVILALLVGYKLLGFLGVLLSVPIAGAIQELVSDINKRKTHALAHGEHLAKEGQEG